MTIHNTMIHHMMIHHMTIHHMTIHHMMIHHMMIHHMMIHHMMIHHMMIQHLHPQQQDARAGVGGTDNGRAAGVAWRCAWRRRRRGGHARGVAGGG